MLNKKITISVGIPACNESANIKRLLNYLNNQVGDNFDLIETIVISDGSTDDTVIEAKSSSLKNVTVIERTDRQGQAKRQNEILEVFKGDALLLLNGDVLPLDNYLIFNAIKPLIDDLDVGIIGIKHVPLPAMNFFEKVINYSVQIKNSLFENKNDGENLYNCRGGARILSRKFADNFRWKITVSEDAYSYMECKRLGFKFVYCKEAAIYYRSPNNLRDHLRQSARFNQGINYLKKQVGGRINHETNIEPGLLFIVVIKYFFKNPILFISYVYIYLVSVLSSYFFKANLIQYNLAKSSKQL